jgi:hypothetical protein
MFRILAIAVTMLGLASAAHADVYKWTDAHGTVQYSDKWVPGSTLIKTDKNHVPPPSAPGAPENTPAAASPSPSEVAAQQRDQRAVAQDVARTKAEQCKQLQEAYTKAVQSRRMYKDGPNGTREYVSDAEADAFRLKLFNDRKQACGS